MQTNDVESVRFIEFEGCLFGQRKLFGAFLRARVGEASWNSLAPLQRPENHSNYDDGMEHAWSCYHTSYSDCETCSSAPTIPNLAPKQRKQMPTHNRKVKGLNVPLSYSRSYRPKPILLFLIRGMTPTNTNMPATMTAHNLMCSTSALKVV